MGRNSQVDRFGLSRAKIRRLPFADTPALDGVAFNSADLDTWLTPQWILEALGTFDLDPCAAAENPQWVCGRSFTKVDDGLVQTWSGRVFMNPPFSNIPPWLKRAAEHGSGISLVPAAVESRTWRDTVWKSAKGVLLLYGRTRFSNPDGSCTTGRPLRSVALVAWSEEDSRVLYGSELAGVYLPVWSQR